MLLLVFILYNFVYYYVFSVRKANSILQITLSVITGLKLSLKYTIEKQIIFSCTKSDKNLRTHYLFWSILLTKVCTFCLKTVYPLNCCSLPLLSPDWLTADSLHSHWLPLAHCDWPTGKRWHRAVLWLGSAGRLTHWAPPPEGVAPPPVEALRREERL